MSTIIVAVIVITCCLYYCKFYDVLAESMKTIPHDI